MRKKRIFEKKQNNKVDSLSEFGPEKQPHMFISQPYKGNQSQSRDKECAGKSPRHSEPPRKNSMEKIHDKFEKTFPALRSEKQCKEDKQ